MDGCVSLHICIHTAKAYNIYSRFIIDYEIKLRVSLNRKLPGIKVAVNTQTKLKEGK